MNQRVTWWQLSIPIILLSPFLAGLVFVVFMMLEDVLGAIRPESEPEICPNANAQEEVYFSQLAGIMATSPIQEHGKHFEGVLDNPTVMMDDDWIEELAVHTVAVREYVADIRELSPPSSVMHIHNLHSQAMDALEEANETAFLGVAHLDGSLFRKAETAMGEAIRLLEEMQAATYTFCIVSKPKVSEPTATSEICPNALDVQERAYFSELDSIIAASPLVELNEQFKQVVGDSSLMAQDDWRRETTTYLVSLQEYAGDVRKLSPPSSVRHIHNLHLRAVSALEQSTEDFIHGVEYTDESSFQRGDATMAVYVQLLDEMAAEIYTFCS